MRPATRLFLAFSALLLVCGVFFVWMAARDYQQSWTGVQLKRCSTLGALVRQYHERHGVYPESLRGLVDKHLVTDKVYGKLKFQVRPWSEYLEWQYHAPQNSQNAILFSGHPVAPDCGSEGMFVFGFADGSTQAIHKKDLQWFMKRTGVDWMRR
jgi:hypothetical protein